MSNQSKPIIATLLALSLLIFIILVNTNGPNELVVSNIRCINYCVDDKLLHVKQLDGTAVQEIRLFCKEKWQNLDCCRPSGYQIGYFRECKEPVVSKGIRIEEY